MLRHSLRIEGICADCQGAVKATAIVPEQKYAVAPNLPLTMIANGEAVEVVKIRGGRKANQRLASMGIRVGDQIEVIQNTFSGPITIRSRDSRLALGHGMAHKIIVKQIT
jgi:Fe2+ transport system protein FeoA